MYHAVNIHIQHPGWICFDIEYQLLQRFMSMNHTDLFFICEIAERPVVHVVSTKQGKFRCEARWNGV